MAVDQDKRKLYCMFWFVMACIAAGLGVIITLGVLLLNNLGG